jgi:hypothetical protein
MAAKAAPVERRSLNRKYDGKGSHAIGNFSYLDRARTVDSESRKFPETAFFVSTIPLWHAELSKGW